jgi:serine/threonine-protein kinase
MNANAGNEHWLELDGLFQRAAELDPSRRAEFLDKACSGNNQLRDELEALLASVDKTLGWLKRPVDSAAREVAFVGRRVGSYVLLRLLGEGGMARVFLAARADAHYRQFVAVKLMHAEIWRSEAMRGRFQAERQILADLNHANIARLLDGGMTSDGIPYLVMELVNGLPIGEYCRENGVSLKEKLELLLQICSAVEYAHKNLVVHRDIKPGNVLIGEDCAPKLVDFGIAKLLEDSGAPTTATTAQLLTPEYASPEQVRGEPITTATDVYGLGALLYYLLSGRHPFAEACGNPIQLMRHICEVDPPPPSRALNGSARREISGDLDRIVLMAMRKEPERRHPSAAALASDLSSYLNGYPLMARSSEWGYRVGKFVRRHRIVVGALTLLILSLAGFSVGMAVLTERANGERLKAEREAAFLADMFRAGTPQEARGRAVTARELLDRGASRVDKELAGEPAVRAFLLYSIADAYSRLGLYDQAKELAGTSYRIRARVLGSRDPATADSLFLFANATRLKGEYAQAEPLFREALDIRRMKFGEGSTVVAETLSFLGECLFLEGKDQEAESNLRQALATFRKHGPDPGGTARDYLARLLERKGDYLEASQLLTEAVEIAKTTEGADGLTYTMALHNLAGALSRLGDLYSAEAKLNESLATERRVLGNGHPDLGYPLNLLGTVALDEGDPRKAEPFLRESFSIWSKLDRSNVLVVSALNNWARLLQAQGKHAEARGYFERALITAQQQPGSTYTVSRVLYNFSLLEFDCENYQAAEEKARRALSMQRSLRGGESAPDTVLTMTTLAEARLFQGDPAGAEPILREALAALKQRLPLEYPSVAAVGIRLGEVLTAEGKAAIAEPILRQALASISAPPFPVPAWQVGEAESALGWCLAILGRKQEARKLLRQCQAKLAADPRPVFRKQAAAHFATSFHMVDLAIHDDFKRGRERDAGQSTFGVLLRVAHVAVRGATQGEEKASIQKKQHGSPARGRLYCP